MGWWFGIDHREGRRNSCTRFTSPIRRGFWRWTFVKKDSNMGIYPNISEEARCGVPKLGATSQRSTYVSVWCYHRYRSASQHTQRSGVFDTLPFPQRFQDREPTPRR